MSVIIPAWNERANLEFLLPALHQTFKELHLQAEILVIDGGSVDGTRETAARIGATVIEQRERGYGGALLAGFSAAQAPFIITMDADLSHRPVFLQEFWKRRDEAEVLIASRYVPGGRADMSVFRRMLSLILNRVFAIVLRLPIRDLSSGFRMYRAVALAKLNFEARDFDVLEEILILLVNDGMHVIEVPFHYTPRATGRSHAKLLKFGIAYVKTLYRMWRLRHRSR